MPPGEALFELARPVSRSMFADERRHGEYVAARRLVSVLKQPVALPARERAMHLDRADAELLHRVRVSIFLQA